VREATAKGRRKQNRRVGAKGTAAHSFLRSAVIGLFFQIGLSAQRGNSMGACGSKTQALASEAGNRMSRALSKPVSSGELGPASEGGARPPRKGKGKGAVDAEAEELARLGLPTDEDRDKGCYLVFDTTSQGTLFSVWSKEKIPGAKARFLPRKEVKAFKFQGNNTRTELVRELQANKKKVYVGWMQFVKNAHDYDAVLQILDDGDRDLDMYYFKDSDSSVHQVSANEFFVVKDARAVGIVPKSNGAYNGVKKSNVEVFMDAAAGNAGAAKAFD